MLWAGKQPREANLKVFGEIYLLNLHFSVNLMNLYVKDGEAHES